MAHPRTPKARARATGRLDKNPGRFDGRNEPVVADPLGDAPKWMNANQIKAWNTIAEEIPWLNRSHRGLVEIAASIRARLYGGEEVGVQALNLLRQCLGQMGATPADASKAGVMPGGKNEDPAEQYF
jgi:hypothetical protein